MDIIYNIKSYYYNFNINFIGLNQNPNINYNILTNTFNNWNSSPIKIIDNIYIGNIFNACNWSIIRDYQFKYIVNLSDNIPNYWINANIKYLNIKLNPNLNSKLNPIDNIIYDQLSIVIDFIEDFQSIHDSNSEIKPNILIHDNLDYHNGLFVIICYIMYKYNTSLEKSIKLIKKRKLLIDDEFTSKYIPLINNYLSMNFN